MSNIDYTTMTLKTLRPVAKERGVGRYYKLNKSELISELTRLDKEANETPRVNGSDVNYRGIRYGRKITTAEVRAYVEDLWGDLMKVSNIRYDGHYWKGDVAYHDGKRVALGVRMDYMISYFRAPRGMAHLEDVKERKAELVAIHS